MGRALTVTRVDRQGIPSLDSEADMTGYQVLALLSNHVPATRKHVADIMLLGSVFVKADASVVSPQRSINSHYYKHYL